MDHKRCVFYIAGVQHHSMYKVLKDLEVGYLLDLIREPENKFDPNAVRIEHNDTMLGYVPAKFSAGAAAILDVGGDIICEIIELNPTARPWEQCKVLLTVIDEFADDEFPNEEGGK